MKSFHALVLSALAAAAGSNAQTVLTQTLASELDRNFSVLKQKADPSPYYMSYEVIDTEGDLMVASRGSIDSNTHNRARNLDVTVRTGSLQFDNYRKTANGRAPKFTSGVAISLDDNPAAIRQQAWLATDATYRLVSQRFTRLKGDEKLRVAAADKAGDFSASDRQVHYTPRPTYSFDPNAWAPRLRLASAEFERFPDALGAQINLQNQMVYSTLVNSEGTQVEHVRRNSRIAISAQGKTSDGMDIAVFEAFDASDPSKLPSELQLRAAVDKAGKNLQDLLKAQPAEPFVGPAILSGKAAGVFFHEIFGHRIEGHRQKDDNDGQTFRTKVGGAVLPDFLNVTFDPTRSEWEGQSLNGFFEYDDEGVAARKVPTVDHGTLLTFLMSRTPIDGFPVSNGHGRRAPGNEVVSRQSNLIVESSKKVSDKELRQMLIEQIKAQDKPYGLYFDQVTGGYTTTQAGTSQAFSVVPLMVYKVFADGRPDELVRGVDIVGTPLASFAKILATGDHAEVFNGFCGAESGEVPVSAVSPALLVSEIEVQRKAKTQDRAPYLPSPEREGK